MNSRRLGVPSEPSGNQFGTFAGVFVPSLLTILGVIMFLRAGFVVGEAGIMGAVLILLIAKAITLLTTFSVSAISTNTQVRGGGAYFMISRVLGAEFGGAIGLALFLAQALSVPFYILGFTEAVVSALSTESFDLQPFFLPISLITALSLFVVAYVGAGWAIKTQYLIMAVLVAAVVVVLGGTAQHFSYLRLVENWGPGYSLLDAEQPGLGKYNLWLVFAIYFPAVTGILAGVNMSGDLKDPAKSIPWGTLYAIGVSAIVYFGLAFLSGAAFERQDLIERPYQTLQDNALWGFGGLVAAGVFAASLSSALGSYLGAPRILQAVARDGILGILKPFAQGSGSGDEPRRALELTGLVTLVTLFAVGGGKGGAAVNAVASVITMFFLYTYGMTNLAAFVEAFGRNPSFRPRFRFFHWTTALLGTISCVGVAFLIDAASALAAALIVAGLLFYLRTRQLETTFGDARRGFFYSSVRTNLLRLATIPEDSKNWRPTILAFSGNPNSRETLVSYAVWLEAGRGIVILANVVTGQTAEHAASRRRMAEGQLREFCRQNKIQAFPVVAVGDDVGQSVNLLLQTVSLGPIRPNLTMFGWPQQSQALARLCQALRFARASGLSLVLLADRGVPEPRRQGRIDVWWRGRKNGELMILLAHLLSRNWEWVGSEIRVLRVIDNEAGRKPASEALAHLVEEARVDAEAVAVVSEDRSFSDILHEESGDAAVVFLGFEIPPEGAEEGWHQNTAQLIEDLPTTLLISSLGHESVVA